MNVFEKIIANKIPCKKILENELVVAFYDIAPIAPIHIVIIPKKSIASLREVKTEDWAFVIACLQAAQQIGEQLGISSRGYRIVTNTGEDGGQEVPHLHFHLIAGRALGALG